MNLIVQKIHSKLSLANERKLQAIYNIIYNNISTRLLLMKKQWNSEITDT